MIWINTIFAFLHKYQAEQILPEQVNIYCNRLLLTVSAHDLIPDDATIQLKEGDRTNIISWLVTFPILIALAD